MIQKVFASKSGNAVFTCPACGKTRHMDVTKYKGIEKAVRLKYTCPCKHVFSVLLERRQHIRKEVSLSGTLIRKTQRYPVEVVNISRQGLRIRIKGEVKVEMDPGEKIVLEFTLDDTTGSTVRKEMNVRSLAHPQIGLEFISSDHYDKFGPYLLFHFN